jgi:hypothetical protein
VIRQQRLYRSREKRVNVTLSKNQTSTGLLYIRLGMTLSVVTTGTPICIASATVIAKFS